MRVFHPHTRDFDEFEVKTYREAFEQARCELSEAYELGPEAERKLACILLRAMTRSVGDGELAADDVDALAQLGVARLLAVSAPGSAIAA